MKDREYYPLLQSSLQSYDTKLWLIPGLFFVIVGFVMTELDKYNFWSFRNGIVFFLGYIFVGLILLYYNKAHLFFLLIQKKINKFDKDFNERIPLASMPERDLIERLRDLEKEDKDFRISCTQYLLVKSRVSFWTRNLILYTHFIFLTLSLLILYINVYLSLK